ncbi:MAG TPA: sulfatase-like hydrolase/transferase [Elusimicrobiota bacterium]|nr:sulfatase-like hydrolase/transferase [Elusimicrobiota bacterium]
MRPELKNTIRNAFRYCGERFLSGGLEAARWIERESLLSLEARTGAATFAGLFFLSLLQSRFWRPFSLPGTDGLLLSLRSFWPEALTLHGILFFASLALGTVVGILFRNAWDILELFAPALHRGRFSRSTRIAAAAAWSLFFHLTFLTRDMAAHPALYQNTFYDAGGALRGFMTFAVERCPAWLGGLPGAAVAMVLFLAVVDWSRRSFLWFMAFPVPARLAAAVMTGGLTLASLGVWGVIRLQAPRNDGPNVLVLMVDSLRSDALENPRFPRLSALAKAGRTYSRCYPNLAATPAALTTFFTGQTPLTHGLRHSFPSPEKTRLGPNSLLPLLKQRGYFTAALTDSNGDFFSSLSENFDTLRAADLSGRRLAQQRALRAHVHLLPYLSGKTGRRLFPALRNLPELSDPALLAEEATSLLGRLRFRKNFFLAVYFSALHSPYAVSSRTALESLEKDYRGPCKYAAPADEGEIATPAEQARVRRLYGANVRAVDAAVGTLLDNLAARHLGENTLVLLWSPYGEQLYERGLGRGHGRHLRGEETLAAPFVVVEPRQRTPPRWIREPVRGQDVAPTLLDILDIPPPETMEGFSLRRRDFSQPPDEFFLVYCETDVWLSGADGDPRFPSRIPYPSLSQMLSFGPRGNDRPSLLLNWEDDVLVGKQRLVQLGTERLLYIPTREGVEYEYYDLASDPHGMHNLAGSSGRAEREQEFREILFRFLSRETGWRPQNGFWIPEAFLNDPDGDPLL